MAWDLKKAVSYLATHAGASSQGRCAEYTRKAIEAGGVVLARHNSAKDYGSSLLAVGFKADATQPYQAGDVVIIQGFAGHPHGHMAMFDGTKWISDFTQSGIYPGQAYRDHQPKYVVYRYGPANVAVPALTDEVAVPTGINKGLICPSADFLTTLLGKPREQLSQSCQPVTNKALAALLKTANVGPFSVTGLQPALESLRLVMIDIQREQHEVYAKLGTAGMLCARLQRNSTKISSHSWGTAIDLKVDGKLDTYGNKTVFYGLTLIAPIFNRHGWYWGASFRKEDGMHFEVSKGKLEQWQAAGLLGKAPTASGSQPTLRRGDKGPAVRQLQEKLNQNGARLKVDGDFGANTEQAVRSFQLKRALKVDGIVGPNTRKALGM